MAIQKLFAAGIEFAMKGGDELERVRREHALVPGALRASYLDSRTLVDCHLHDIAKMSTGQAKVNKINLNSMLGCTQL